MSDDDGDDADEDIHRDTSRSTGSWARLPPESEELSTEREPAAATGDMVSGALQSARSMAGRPGLRSRGSFASRRRSNAARGGGYSGARPDGRDPARLGDIVGKSLSELGWIAPLAEARLMGQWASVVGPEIATRCHPVSLTEGELRITAESTAWATQLRLMAPQLLSRISNELPAGMVRKLIISGPSAPSWKHGPWSMRGGRGARDTYG